MDEPRTFECPSCGGELTTDGLTPTIKCPYCGRTVSVPQDLRVQPPPAPQAPPQAPFVTLLEAAEKAAELERANERRSAPQPAPRRRSGCGCGPLIFAVVLILAVLIGGAIYTGNGPALLRALDSLSGATPTPKPISTPLAAALPRSTRYAGVVFTVTGGRLTNTDLSTREVVRYRSDRLYAELQVKLDNTAGDRPVSLSGDVVRLELGDGNQYRQEGPFAFDVEAGATKTTALYFPLPRNATWKGAKLLLREPGKEPAVLPFDGPAPAVPALRDLKLATEKTVGTIVYRVVGTSLDTARDGVQVDLGKRFLRLKLRVVNNGKEPGGALVTGANFRLLLDGESLAPDASLIEAIPPQSKVDGNVDFTVPADARSATLQVGELNGPQAAIPVNLKP